MKDFVPKEFYCYKNHTPSAKSSANSHSTDNLPTWITFPFLRENLDPPFSDFSKVSPRPLYQ